jgi:excisionase family DNA binding protein
MTTTPDEGHVRPMLMTAPEAAAYLRLNRTTLYRFAAEGKIPYLKVGSHYRFRKEALDAWMAQGTELPGVLPVPTPTAAQPRRYGGGGLPPHASPLPKDFVAELKAIGR